MKKFHVLDPHVAGTTRYEIGDIREADEAEVQHLVELKVLGDKAPKKALDYEQDGLAKVDLAKATKDQLLVIAAYETADAPKGADHTEAELRKAIEAKRKAA